MADKKPNKKKKQGNAAPALVAWFVAATVLIVVLRLWTGPAAIAYGELGVELPGLAMVMLSWGTWLEPTLHLLIAFGALSCTALPFLVGIKGKSGTKLYASLALVGCLAVAGSWFTLKRPIDTLAERLGTHASPR